MTDADKIHKAKKQGNKIFLVKPKLVDGDNSTPYGYETTKRLFDEWSKECEVQRVRADKFGHEYSVPQLESFLKWSEAKRMRSAPQTAGFITGIDTESKEEEDKRAKRQERFEADRKRELAKKRGREGEEEMEEEVRRKKSEKRAFGAFALNNLLQRQPNPSFRSAAAPPPFCFLSLNVRCSF